MDNLFNLIPILWRLKHMCMLKLRFFYREEAELPSRPPPSSLELVPKEVGCGISHPWDNPPPPSSKTTHRPWDGHHVWIQDVHTSVVM